MKKIIILSFIGILSVSFFGCKSEKKREEVKQVISKKEALFSLDSAKHKINFIAYKTSDKLPVKGEFKKVMITSGGKGNTIKEAIHTAEFSIPVSSIFTKDTSRDFKIQKFFFGIMDKTTLLSGKLMIDNDSIGTASIKMNGVTNKVPFKYTINNNEFTLNAVMDINNWNAGAALLSLNEACKVLHTGADGVSKTWSDVSLNIISTF